MNNLQREYTRLRKLGFQASNALSYARTLTEFRSRECGEWDEPELGDVRLRIVPDEHADMDDLKGDCFNRKVNPDVQESRMQREENDFEERVRSDGVWGIVGEYWDGSNWQHADSVWGFVGDAWRNSGYDFDIMQSALNEGKKLEL